MKPLYVQQSVLKGDREALSAMGRRGGMARRKATKAPVRRPRSISVLEQRPRIPFDPNAVRVGKDAAAKD